MRKEAAQKDRLRPAPIRPAFRLAAPLLAAAIAHSSGCGGITPGDERALWSSATFLEAPDSPSRAYAGVDDPLPAGFLTQGYSNDPVKVPLTRSEMEARVLRLIMGSMSQDVFDFSYPETSGMIGNDIFLFMTDMDAWPNAYYSKGMARVYGMQVLDGSLSIISDCPGGCRFVDVIAIKNRSFAPSSDDPWALEPAQQDALSEPQRWASEELGSDLFQDGIDKGLRSSFIDALASLWASGVADIEQEEALAYAYTHGGLPQAIGSSGLNAYALKPYIQEGLSSAYPTASAATLEEMEVALVSYLQMIGEHASSLVGLPGRCYLDYYRKLDQAAGRPEGDHLHYRQEFVERESYSHIGSLQEKRRVYPSCIRPCFDGFYRPYHLDFIFNDGFKESDPIVRDNAFLSDCAGLEALVAKVVPGALSAYPH